jgi:hypothetical protein
MARTLDVAHYGGAERPPMLCCGNSAQVELWFSSAKLLRAASAPRFPNVKVAPAFSPQQPSLHSSIPNLSWFHFYSKGLFIASRAGTMSFRNALRLSSRTVGAISASGRIAAVSSLTFTPGHRSFFKLLEKANGLLSVHLELCIPLRA